MVNQNISGNVKVLKVHLDALEKLVSMRGGSEKLGKGGILHTSVFWYELESPVVLVVLLC